MKAANSLKADNYRRAESSALCCEKCEHFEDNGPYRRFCHAHILGPASAYSGAVAPTIAAYNICDKFMQKLRECPFCGSGAKINKHPIFGYYVSCNAVHLCGAKTRAWDEVKSAVATWNRRAVAEGVAK